MITTQTHSLGTSRSLRQCRGGSCLYLMKTLQKCMHSWMGRCNGPLPMVTRSHSLDIPREHPPHLHALSRVLPRPLPAGTSEPCKAVLIPSPAAHHGRVLGQGAHLGTG